MKNYRVKKFPYGHKPQDFGILPESDVKELLKGFKYDRELEMWFNRKATVGYDIQEV